MKPFRLSLLLAIFLLFQSASVALAVAKRRRTLKKSYKKGKKKHGFNRISNFFICEQIDADCNTDDTTNVRNVAASLDGRTLLYANPLKNETGFIDITDPHYPKAKGTLSISGGRGIPTSIKPIRQRLAVVSVNTSKDFVNTSGQLVVIDIPTQTIKKTFELGGQPDSLDVSPDHSFVVVTVKNKRNPNSNNGQLPQLPAGFLVVFSKTNPADLSKWEQNVIALSNLSGAYYSTDPQPESVSINKDNIAVITLQENNAIALVDLTTQKVIKSFSAGTVDLTDVDADENGIIEFYSSLFTIPREPDGVYWMGPKVFATADEGNYNGGSRTFTIYNKTGDVLYNSGSELDHIAASLGHFPEKRAKQRGNEPETIVFATYEGKYWLFINSERSNLVFVYNVKIGPDGLVSNPKFVQALPTGVEPEGLVVIPKRDLFIVANEKDNRKQSYRSSISIYSYVLNDSYTYQHYPTLVSKRDKDTGIPKISWTSLTSMTNGKGKNQLYAVQGSFLNRTRFFEIQVNKKHKPNEIKSATEILDSNNILASVTTDDEFTDDDLNKMINSDGTVNLDAEGIAFDGDDYLYIVSESKGARGQTHEKVERINLILKVHKDSGIIEKVIRLPSDIESKQGGSGLKGIDIIKDQQLLVVAFRSKVKGYDNPLILRYDLGSDKWVTTYWEYCLDKPESPNGGKVGIFELSVVEHKGSCRIFVLERDNQGGPDSRIKRLYRFTCRDGPQTCDDKKLIINLNPILDEVSQGNIPVKVDGMTYLKDKFYFLNDNGGVDGSFGATYLFSVDYRQRYREKNQ
jgi:hypothetical protein